MKKTILTLSFLSFVAVGFSNQITIITSGSTINLLALESVSLDQDTNKTTKEKSASANSKNKSSKSAATNSPQNDNHKYKVKDSKIIEQRKTEIKNKDFKKEQKKNPLYKEIEVKN